MNANPRIAQVWLLPITIVAIGVAGLLALASAPSSGEYAPIERHVDAGAAGANHIATNTPEPQVTTAIEAEADPVREDNHPPTF